MASGPQPNAFLHLLGGEFIARMRFVGFRQISEGHRGRYKMDGILWDGINSPWPLGGASTLPNYSAPRR